jgi:tetratricopeptide (TPR) repeat protein
MKQSLFRLRAVVLPMLLLACGLAPAQSMGDPKWRGYTQGEWALMPEWCIDSQDGPYGSPEGAEYMNKSPRARQWVSLMGKDFWHMHHYCRALRDMQRARSATISKRDRDFVLARAVGDFEYVINNCQPSMVLMPEVYLRFGDLYMMRNDPGNAGLAYEQSRKLKPDYWPAYDRWINVLVDLKKWDTARRLAEEGLALMPGEPNLTAQLKRIEAATGRRSTPAPSTAQAPTLR